MREIFERVGDGAAAAAGVLLLAACASSPPKTTPLVTPARNDPAAAASYDWHPLVIAPFGTRLVDSPIRLHEVLLFHEQPHAPAEIESKDCYAADGGTAPAFMGLAPDEYLMCFEHDRLDRIEVSVRIAAGDAAGDFGRACALWSRNAEPLPPADDTCEGRDGDIAFSARLLVLPGERTAELLMTLSNAARLDAEREPPGDPGPTSPATP
jgi:hypothetical protein